MITKKIIQPLHGDRAGELAFFLLRGRVWACKHRWEPRSLDGTERDTCDQHSTFILLCEGEQVLAGCRVIDGHNGPLPIATHCPHVDFGVRYEVSRLCVDHHALKHISPEYGCSVLMVLIDAVSKYIRSFGCDACVAIVRYSLLETLRKCGLSTTVLGSCITHGHHHFVPVRILV